MRPMGQQSVVEVGMDQSHHSAGAVVHEPHDVCQVN
jgi:hypothetical protein